MSKTKITEVMMDDKTIDASKEIAMVFSIANTLRGPYKPDKYKDVIIPMIILRRLECALAPTKKAWWMHSRRILPHLHSYCAKSPAISSTIPVSSI